MLLRFSTRRVCRPARPSFSWSVVTEPAVAFRRRATFVLVLTSLAACGGGELTLPNQGQPSEIALVRGNRQTGTTDEPLGDSLVVRVVDRFGAPVVGAEVVWTAE